MYNGTGSYLLSISLPLFVFPLVKSLCDLNRCLPALSAYQVAIKWYESPKDVNE